MQQYLEEGNSKRFGGKALVLAVALHAGIAVLLYFAGSSKPTKAASMDAESAPMAKVVSAPKQTPIKRP